MSISPISAFMVATSMIIPSIFLKPPKTYKLPQTLQAMAWSWRLTILGLASSPTILSTRSASSKQKATSKCQCPTSTWPSVLVWLLNSFRTERLCLDSEPLAFPCTFPVTICLSRLRVILSVRLLMLSKAFSRKILFTRLKKSWPVPCNRSCQKLWMASLPSKMDSPRSITIWILTGRCHMRQRWRIRTCSLGSRVSSSKRKLVRSSQLSRLQAACSSSTVTLRPSSRPTSQLTSWNRWATRSCRPTRSTCGPDPTRSQKIFRFSWTLRVLGSFCRGSLRNMGRVSLLILNTSSIRSATSRSDRVIVLSRSTARSVLTFGCILRPIRVRRHLTWALAQITSILRWRFQLIRLMWQ